MSSESYHEPLDQLSTETRTMHQALVSLREELEAVDWYRQRADACGDEELKQILLHNMREEMEHACMVLEWLRRHNADFAGHMQTYLFTEPPITEIEEEDTGNDHPAESQSGQQNPNPAKFTVGDLKGE